MQYRRIQLQTGQIQSQRRRIQLQKPVISVFNSLTYSVILNLRLSLEQRHGSPILLVTMKLSQVNFTLEIMKVAMVELWLWFPSTYLLLICYTYTDFCEALWVNLVAPTSKNLYDCLCLLQTSLISFFTLKCDWACKNGTCWHKLHPIT